MELGNLPKSDDAFTARYRLHQAQYRAKVLKEPQGFGPTNKSKNKYGNYLVNGETTGSNFISSIAFSYAKERVLDKKTNRSLTIDEYRLFNNMLSSMPMCFNLFSDLRHLLSKNPEAATEIVKHLFRELPWIYKLVDLQVEFIPTPIKDYTNDKSAFDAMLIVQDQKGKKGLISIETKYTDILGGNVAADSETKNALAEKGDFFSAALKAQLKTNGYRQIHRNFVLTYAYASRSGFEHFANVVISPADDLKSMEEINELKSGLKKYQDCIFKISLEDIVERGISYGNKHFSEVMQNFKRRYISDKATL